MMIDIVMLSLTNSDKLYEMTCNAIKSLRESETNIKFNVILVESNKNRDITKYPYTCADRVVVPRDEFNYNKFCKIGISHGNNEWVALCNNDLIFHKGWMSEIVKVDDDMKGYIQSYSPWNPYNGWHDQLIRPDINNYKAYEGYRTSYEVAGWCLVTKRQLLTTIKLDDRVNFWFSDNVYIDEMQKIGVRHALVRNSKVSHICSETSKTLDSMEYINMTSGQQRPYMEGR